MLCNRYVIYNVTCIAINNIFVYVTHYVFDLHYDFEMFTLYVEIFYSSGLGLGLGLDPALRPGSSGLGLGLGLEGPGLGLGLGLEGPGLGLGLGLEGPGLGLGLEGPGLGLGLGLEGPGLVNITA
jgi:hypothetical protein